MARSATARRTKKAATAALDGDDVRVGIYVRRSTDDENQPYSIEVQDTRLEAYISSQPGWRLVARFTDDASGATTERDGLHRALAAARAGVIDVLLVYRVDRFTRNLRDMVMLLDELDQAGVVFRSATEPFDTSTPIGRMLVQMLGMFAQFERDLIIDRVIGGMERKAANGKWKGGKRPFGYRMDPATHTLVTDPAESVIVRLIFDLYTRDRIGSRAIANILNERGHRTTSGGRWSGHQVLRALNNRVYLGELTFRDITTTDTHEPIIATQTWEQAQTILDARGENHAHRAANSSDYILTGRLRCPKCGKAMVGTRATGRTKTYRYYTCWTLARYDTSKCDFARLNADAVDQAILDALATFYRSQHSLIADAVRHHRPPATPRRPLRPPRRTRHHPRRGHQDRASHRPLPHRVRERHTRRRPRRRPPERATHQGQAAPRPPRGTHPHPRQRTRRTRPRHPRRGRRQHHQDHHNRGDQPDQGPRRNPRRRGHHHRTRPTHPGLPHPTTPQPQRGRPRSTSGNGLEGTGSHNDYIGGAEGNRTPDLLDANESRYQLRHSPVPGGSAGR
jgi:site-specific DNA recombinase